MMTAKTCTVRKPTTQGGGCCGAPAVYVEGEFAECAKHAAEPGAMAKTARKPGPFGAPAVGAEVAVRRHGKTYTGRVVRVTRTGTVYAEVVYGTGTRRVVKV